MRELIAEAVALAGGNLCAAGHEWTSEGGRQCPKYEHAGCSQTVYRCDRCGDYDYGEKGGLAHRECFTGCRRTFEDEIAEDAALDAELNAPAAELLGDGADIVGRDVQYWGAVWTITGNNYTGDFDVVRREKRPNGQVKITSSISAVILPENHPHFARLVPAI